MTLRFLVGTPLPPPPLWDTVWLGTVAVSVGDLLVLAGAYIAYHVFDLQRDTQSRQRQQSSLDHLEGVKVSLADWYDHFFTASYDDGGAIQRARDDREAIMQRTYIQNFLVPTEPVASLIQPTGDLWPFSAETVKTANVALSKVTVFNQFVHQQSEFNLLHAADLQRISEDQLKSISEAAMRISTHIHQAIGDAAWYNDLKRAVSLNIAELWVLLAAGRFHRSVHDPVMMTGAHMQPNRWRSQHARPGLVPARTRRDSRLSCRRSDCGVRLDRSHPWT